MQDPSRQHIHLLRRALLVLLLLILATEAGIQSSKFGQQRQEAAQLTLPQSYDVRSAGKTPVVKSQGTLGTCWAITATSALEAAFLPETDPVFSADHMSLNNGFVISQKEGGDYKMIMAYLSGWHGPVLEEDDPYGDGESAADAPVRAHVQSIRLLEDADRTLFQEMIYTCGPVQTSLYMDRKTTSRSLDYYNEETFGYYYPEEKAPTHDVLILGWDDNYSRENFKIRPEHDGAYLCQNTWGTRFGDQGVFYVSYEDANIARSGLAYLRVEPADNYDHIYQTDVCGWQGRQGYDKESCYFSNVYTAQGEEALRAVGFYSIGERSSYEVSIVHDFTGPDSLTDRKLLGKGFVEGKGYFTVDLPEEEPLSSGERFAVVVRITTPGVEKPVAVEIKKDVYTQRVTTEGKEGYLSLHGENWENAEEQFGTNLCLKAYTTDLNLYIE